MKVIVISGFLGSGKTTLIKQLTRQFKKDEANVILVNDFGSINFDNKILTLDGIEVMPLQNGCVCCSLRGTLIQTIQDIHSKLNPSNLYIEPSGIASVDQIKAVLNINPVDKIVSSSFIVNVLDAKNFHTFKNKLGDFFINQLDYADIIVINKTDLVSDSDLDHIKSALHQQNPDAAIYLTQYGYIPISLLSGKDDNAIKVSLDIVSKHSYNEPDFDILNLKLNQAIDKNKLLGFVSAIQDRSVGQVFRIKGIYKTSAGCYTLSVVLDQIDIAPCEDTELGLVIIGVTLDKETITKLFNKYLR